MTNSSKFCNLKSCLRDVVFQNIKHLSKHLSENYKLALQITEIQALVLDLKGYEVDFLEEGSLGNKLWPLY